MKVNIICNIIHWGRKSMEAMSEMAAHRSKGPTPISFLIIYSGVTGFDDENLW